MGNLRQEFSESVTSDPEQLDSMLYKQHKTWFTPLTEGKTTSMSHPQNHQVKSFRRSTPLNLILSAIALTSTVGISELPALTQAVAIGQPSTSSTLTALYNPSNPNFASPLSRLIVNSLWGYRIDPIAKTRFFHNGVDFDGTYGAPVMAASGGVVEFAGTKSDSFNSAYGIHIIIDHGNGFKTIYGHLSSTLVTTGQRISQSQIIGKMGSTGRSTGVHLHFEVRQTGAPIDPLGLNTVNPLNLLPKTYTYHPLASTELLGGIAPDTNIASAPRTSEPIRTPQPSIGSPQPEINSVGIQNSGAKELHRRCPSQTSLAVAAETTNYYVGICRSTRSTFLKSTSRSFYIGVEKLGSGSLTAPVEQETVSLWTARNREYTYTVDLNNRQLVVRGPGIPVNGYIESIVWSQNLGTVNQGGSYSN